MTHSIFSPAPLASLFVVGAMLLSLSASNLKAASPTGMPATIAPFDVRQAVMTITEVKTPWYAVRFLLKRGFEKSLPEYNAIQGLLQKNYAIHEGGTFGGFYLWATKAQAEAWFNTTWFERVERTYGAPGKVSYFAVREYQTFASESDAKGDYWTVTHRSSSHTAQHSFPQVSGLFRFYAVTDMQTGQQGSISLWRSKEEAERYFTEAKIPENELMYTDTPLLINHLRNQTAVK